MQTFWCFVTLFLISSYTNLGILGKLKIPKKIKVGRGQTSVDEGWPTFKCKNFSKIV